MKACRYISNFGISRFGELKVENFSSACERSANVVVSICWDSRTYVSHRSHVNNKCISLTSYNFLFFFFFNFQSFRHCTSRFRFASLIAKSREKLSFSLSCCTSALLWFDNMENLEDTFRLLLRFARGRRYAILIRYTSMSIARILHIRVWKTLQRM